MRTWPRREEETKISRIILLAAVVAALCVASLSVGGANLQAEASTTYLARLEIGRSELRCDGDGTYLEFEIRRVADNEPAPNIEVTLSARGLFTARDRSQTTDVYVGPTNSHGVLRVHFAPTHPGLFPNWLLVFRFGEGEYPTQHNLLVPGTCAFLPDTTYVLRGEIFVDQNADGVRNRGERLFSGKWIALSASGSNVANRVLNHHARTDENGAFLFTGLPQDPQPNTPQEWTLRLGVQQGWAQTHPWPRKVNESDDDYEIVTVNGQLAQSIPTRLALGENYVSIGVRRAP